jgi:hypothetical protein
VYEYFYDNRLLIHQTGLSKHIYLFCDVTILYIPKPIYLPLCFPFFIFDILYRNIVMTNPIDSTNRLFELFLVYWFSSEVSSIFFTLIFQIGRLHCLLPWWEDATVDFMVSGGYNVLSKIKQVVVFKHPDYGTFTPQCSSMLSFCLAFPFTVLCCELVVAIGL